MPNIQFRDLKKQYEKIKPIVDERIQAIVNSAHFISGPEVKELESILADYVDRKHCITCANGTDAITIALRAAGIGPGDAVFVPDFTFFSSGESPAILGATPIFVDVDSSTYNILGSSLEEAIKRVIEDGKLNPAAVVAVDLFGQPFDYDVISSICEKYDLLLLEDAAQGFGGEYTSTDGLVIKAGKLGKISTTSFFPAKPLGCFGDGGAIFTDDDELALLCRSIAVHGKEMSNPGDPNAKYNNRRLGYNSRLDTIQAGILLAKFDVFREYELDQVNHVSRKYGELLSEIDELSIPIVSERYYSSWAQYTIQLPLKGTSIIEQQKYRIHIQEELKKSGIPTNIYYPKPMHTQGAFESTMSSIAYCPNTEQLCRKVLCLPIHPYLEDEEVEYVADRLNLLI